VLGNKIDRPNAVSQAALEKTFNLTEVLLFHANIHNQLADLIACNGRFRRVRVLAMLVHVVCLCAHWLIELAMAQVRVRRQF
jgi:hypothetical protein